MDLGCLLIGVSRKNIRVDREQFKVALAKAESAGIGHVLIKLLQDVARHKKELTRRKDVVSD